MPDVPKWSWSSKTETGMKNHHIHEECVVWCSETEEGDQIKRQGNGNGVWTSVVAITLKTNM